MSMQANCLSVLFLIVFLLFVPSEVSSQFIVDPTITWQSTGDYINAGDQLQISATGTVCFYGACTNETEKDPNGCCPLLTNPCDCRTAIAGSGFLAPNCWAYGLVGKIGVGQPFNVGECMNFVSTDSGELFLAFNDTETLNDNSGSYTVYIVINSILSIFPFEEEFSENVFCDKGWIRKDTTVYVDETNGWLRIDSNTVHNDYAEKFGPFQLPIVIRWRERTFSGEGSVPSLPKLELWWAADDSNNLHITYVDNNDGWLLRYWSATKILGTTNWNEWREVRAMIRNDGGELFAKMDNDPDFTFITDTTWSIPNMIEKIRLSQHSDNISDFDYLRVGCCINLRGDANDDGDESNILDLNYAVNRIFRNGPPASCFEEGNPNGDGSSLNILDLNYFVNRIFRGGPPPVLCPW